MGFGITFIIMNKELDQELLEILACPKCQNDLTYQRQDQKLICNKCLLIYEIKNGIPNMLINEAENA